MHACNHVNGDGNNLTEIGELRQHLASDPNAIDEKRYEALRLASEASVHATPGEVVERAKAYFEFLQGE